MNCIVIDVSSFDTNGGWVLDTQFVTNMGTPYPTALYYMEKTNIKTPPMPDIM